MNYRVGKGMPLWAGIAILTVALWVFVSIILKRFQSEVVDATIPNPVARGETEKPDPADVFAAGDTEEETEELLTEALSAPGFAHEDFLRTDYEPLHQWLNERFEVQYRAMTPALIFEQVPLSDIFYEVGELSATDEPFHFQSSDVSRRDLLREIANHWNLEMNFALDEQGNPTAVRVEKR